MTVRPREKLIQQGVSSLEDQELLAIILGHGTAKENVFDASKRLLSGFDQDEIAMAADPETFCRKFHVSFVQGCKLLATFELGRRFFRRKGSNATMRNAQEAYVRLKNMSELKKEHLRGIYLNSRYTVIHDEVIAIGGLALMAVEPREIFRPAIEYGACAIILGHNHPSGNCTPSKEDLEMTKKVMNLGMLLQIAVLDHLIIGSDNFTSIVKVIKKGIGHKTKT